MTDPIIDWRPRIAANKRLAELPDYWKTFKVDDQVGIYLGNCWRKGTIKEIFPDYAVVAAKRLGSSQVTTFNVYDSRNVCHVRELVKTNINLGPTLFD